MRVNLITRHAIRNYGSVLQAIATKELLSESNCETKIVDYRQPGYDDTGWSVANRGSVRDHNYAVRVAYAALRDPSMRKIGRVFEKALGEHFSLTERFSTTQSLMSAGSSFSEEDLYCVGSDQVWNLEYNKDNGPYYLEFAPLHSRKFSLASSIGANILPGNEEERLLTALETFSGISVRESSARDYLSSLGVDAHQHVDPTLGVRPGFWLDFANSVPVHKGQPYILVYQLNGAADFNPVLDQVAQTLGLAVKRIEYWRGPRSLRYPSCVLPDINEFVALFRDASYVVTDSFHGTVFSTIFEVPYVAVAPPKYAGRITSLLTLTNQQSRLIDTVVEAKDFLSSDPSISIDRSILENERLKLQSYVSTVTN